MSITVVIPSYGYGHLVAHAIDSVLAQTLQPERIIVVDDGANDGVYEVASKYDVSVIKRPHNLGILKNFNDILLNFVKTEKVMFLGADNYLRPDALEKLNLDYDIVSYDLALVGSHWQKTRKLKDVYTFKDGYYIKRFKKYPNILKKIIRANVIHGSALYNAKMAQKLGGYERGGKPDRKKLNEDWGLWKKLLHNGATHYHVSEPLLYYRKHQFNFNGIY